MDGATETFDVIIIGGGPAGMSCAMWCDELGMRAILLEANSELGGQLLWTYNPIKNYPGVETKNGRELRDIFLNQLASRNFVLRTACEVISLDVETKTVSCSDGSVFRGKAIVIATGVRRRKLGIPGEEEFIGRGILESGARDRELVRDKRVCVIGGGDAALENALILAEYASEVLLVHRRKEFRARKEFVERVRANPRVRIFLESEVKSITGEDCVSAVEIAISKENSNKVEPVDFVLVRIGADSNIRFLPVEPKSGKSDLQDDLCGKYEAEFVFAIGDVVDSSALTISNAVGTGSSVAKRILRILGGYELQE